MADEATINVVDPYGQQVTIPLSELAKATSQGYRPATGAEVNQQQIAQKYDQPGQAFLEGVGRGATFGLASGGTDAEAARQQVNPLAAGLGEASGFVATGGALGLGEAAGAAGRAAFGGSGLLARAGASAVRGAIEGAAMGAGQGISDVALSQDPMSAEAIVGTLGHRILTGAALGGAASAGTTLVAGGLGAAIGKAGQVVTKVADKLQGELIDDSGGALAQVDPALRSEVMAMGKPELDAGIRAEQSMLDAQRATDGKSFASDLNDFYHENRNELFKIRQQLPDKALMKTAIRASEKVKDLAGDLKSLAEEPELAIKPLRRLGQSLEDVKRYLPDQALGDMPQRIEALENRAVDMLGDPTSARLEAMQARLEALSGTPKPTPTLDAMTKGVGASIGGAAGGLVGGHVGAAAGAWLGKELAETVKPLMKKVLGGFVDHAQAITDGAAALAGKVGAPSAAMDALNDLAATMTVQGATAYEKATKAISQAANDPGTPHVMQQQLAALAQGSPQLAQQVQQGMLAKLNFLASKIPPAVLGPFGKPLPPSDTEMQSFARYVAAANDPLRLLKEIGAMQLMPETVETHATLFPSMKAKLEEALTTHLTDPNVAAKVPYAMRLELGMLLGPSAEPTLAPDFVAAMQQPFMQPPQAGKPPGGSSQNPAQDATAAQRLMLR